MRLKRTIAKVEMILRHLLWALRNMVIYMLLKGLLASGVLLSCKARARFERSMQKRAPGRRPEITKAPTLFLNGRAEARQRSLNLSIAVAPREVDKVQLNYAFSVLVRGHNNVKLKPLTFRCHEKPDVSIIMPVHNNVEVTYSALCSLLLAYNNASYEVIVVDDASHDDTVRLETLVCGITVLHNEFAQRFVRACNRGAEQAKGKYIVLLNNDVEVTSGWLDELVDAFGHFGKVGLAGSKLLYPSGQLQDAGGIVWNSGNPWNYGKGQHPNDPRSSYARQADYLTGAAMMVPTKLWRELGGLSSYLEPMYFEDTDFAFKVREAGYTTWFVPSSVVYHYEGLTSGTDVSAGFKSYQEINRPKFKQRWAESFAGFGKEGSAPDLEKDRCIVGRILFVDHRTPRPDQDAGSYAAIQEMCLVQSLGYKVTFLPADMAHEGHYTEQLQKMGVEVIYAPFQQSPEKYLAKHAQDFDGFYITRYQVAERVLDHVRKFAPESPVIFNNADLHFLREIRSARVENSETSFGKAYRTLSREMAVINKVDLLVSYSEAEHSIIHTLSNGQAAVMKCSWVVKAQDTRAPLVGRIGMSFLGSFGHPPNAQGLKWFVRDILPAVYSKAGAIPLSIYGSAMTHDIRALKTDLIDPIGFIENAEDAFDRHRIFVAPLLSGAGIKGKVLSAMASGIPCILTPTAAEGIGLHSGHDCIIAERPEDWVTGIQNLSIDDVLWTTIADNAQSYVRNSFSFDCGRTQMRKIFDAVGLHTVGS